MSGRLTLLLLFVAALLVCIVGKTTFAQVKLETIKVEMAGCVKYDHENPKYVFKTKDALITALRAYKDGPDCKDARKIDFDKYILMGLDFYNAECHGVSIDHKVIRDDDARLYRFQVEHSPFREICEGIYHHELWILAPKPPEGYDVVFEIGEKAK